MPFRNPALIVARILRLIGNAGQKIEASVDNTGTPRIDFYTGAANEAEPASIFTQQNFPLPGRFAIIIEGPDPTTANVDEARLILESFETVLENPNEGGIIVLRHSDTGNLIEIGANSNLGFAIRLASGDGGPVQIDADLNTDTIRLGGLGDRIDGFDGGQVTDNTGSGNGTLNYSHNLGAGTKRIIAIASGVPSGRFITRVTGGDTNSTFQCRAWNADGSNPPNGTAVAAQYVGWRVP
jgi:hypothetical protein